MTHPGDPHPRGWWGVSDCMGEVRDFEFDAVIGIGGKGSEPQRWGMDEKLIWIGLEPKWSKSLRKSDRGSLVRFKHFLYCGNGGPLLADHAGQIATKMYANSSHFAIESFTKGELSEIKRLLRMAENAPKSDTPPKAAAHHHHGRCGC